MPGTGKIREGKNWVEFNVQSSAEFQKVTGTSDAPLRLLFLMKGSEAKEKIGWLGGYIGG